MNIDKRSFLQSVLYGLAPHTFCILFVIFSVVGTTLITTFLRPFLLNVYFFYFLILLSFTFATLSSFFYLRKNGILSLNGVKRKWRYLSIMYGATIFINLLLFWVIFPFTANLNFGLQNKSIAGSSVSNTIVTLKVAIPCSGHASLISGDLKTIDGVDRVIFRFPNYFDVYYNQSIVSEEKILSLEVFKTYKATIIK